MLKNISEITLENLVRDYTSQLKNLGFTGDIHLDYATRLTLATDNSVYQVIPLAALFPKTTQDIQLIMYSAHNVKFNSITFSPRGGGTATNGQSLSQGIIIDCSKYMTDILEINVEQLWVRVQPGVILDQLNTFLKSLGMHFAPEISPSNRATIGGMINTDACGNGSKLIGRTSDHILELTCVRSNGELLNTAEENSELTQPLTHWLSKNQALIHEKFKNRPRNLNGYNLLKTYHEKINLNYLISGSEGTLAIVSEAKLKITPIPKYKKLILIKYKNFEHALRFKPPLLIENNISIVETIDEALLNLARTDPIYFYLKDILDSDVIPDAINLIEIVAKNANELNAYVSTFVENFRVTYEKYPDISPIGYYIAKNEFENKLLWDLRKRSVGLISKKCQGYRRPIPFVEDTAVPPEKLANYIKDFKSILDQHHLYYGMYGHVDAGCVHVRPALDLQQQHDEQLFSMISDQVAKLVENYGGVMWGEHGMGFRSQYAEHFFGEELYYVVRQIKTLFDPNNRLNPGKIAIPIGSQDSLVKITEPLRAEFDKSIPQLIQKDYPEPMACNGNGACFNWATQDVMCPSYKVTKDRIHSPKGRAVLMREWLRLKYSNKKDLAKTTNLSNQVYAAMNGCLSCKACTSQCPLNVDVPDFKAKFLFEYHRSHSRSLRDYLVAFIEPLAAWQGKFPKLSQWFLSRPVTRIVINKIFKLTDIPNVASGSIKKELEQRNITVLDLKEVTQFATRNNNSVILIQDTFTSFYEPDVLLKIIDFLKKMDFEVYVSRIFSNGKPLHIKGFLDRFTHTVKKNNDYLGLLAKANIPLVGIDPSMTLIYRDEYKKILGENLNFRVHLLQEWLIHHQSRLKQVNKRNEGKTYYLLSHCTEKTMCVAAEKQWQEIFESMKLKLIPLAAGCCGMSGIYGHELEHVQNSKNLFSMDWKRYFLNNPESEKIILSTGYSCRSQVKRLQGLKLQHPIEALLSVT